VQRVKVQSQDRGQRLYQHELKKALLEIHVKVPVGSDGRLVLERPGMMDLAFLVKVHDEGVFATHVAYHELDEDVEDVRLVTKVKNPYISRIAAKYKKYSGNTSEK